MNSSFLVCSSRTLACMSTNGLLVEDRPFLSSRSKTELLEVEASKVADVDCVGRVDELTDGPNLSKADDVDRPPAVSDKSFDEVEDLAFPGTSNLSTAFFFFGKTTLGLTKVSDSAFPILTVLSQSIFDFDWRGVLCVNKPRTNLWYNSLLESSR